MLATEPSYREILKKVNVSLHPVENPDGAQLAYELQKLTPTIIERDPHRAELLDDGATALSISEDVAARVRDETSGRGVDVIIDETPSAVVLSSFDGFRREVARVTLERLIADGRINPAQIEETYEHAREAVEQRIVEEGERAALETRVNGLDPELMRMLGKLHYRTSYGQNVLDHLIECSSLAGLIAELKAIPGKLQETIVGSEERVRAIARSHAEQRFFLYLGRHIGLPVALEGALKLKEISYIPTEAYSAGEMKHGPIALLDEDTPVVCIATNSHVYDKVVSNIQETRARGAHVIAIATDGNEDIQHHADDVIYIPKSPAFLQAVLAIVPLQLLAYRIARLRGLNVDQPRNLAKTVTVE